MDDLTKRALRFAEQFALKWVLDNDVPEDLRDDAKQEAFVETLRRVKTFDADLGARLEEWVRAQMEPRLHRWLKKQRMAGVTAPPSDGDLPSMINATVDGAVEEEVSETPEEALRKLRRLTPAAKGFLLKAREAMDQGRTQEEIARELGVSRRAVGRRLERLTEKLLRPDVPISTSLGNPVTGNVNKQAKRGPRKGAASRSAMGSPLRKLIEDHGYPASAADGQRGVRSPRSGPGTLSTRCSEWSSSADFWTPERRKAREQANAAVAFQRREWRAAQWRDLVRTEEEQAVQMEGHEDTTLSADDDGHREAQQQVTAYLLRQAETAKRYKGRLIKGAADELDEKDPECD